MKTFESDFHQYVDPGLFIGSMEKSLFVDIETTGLSPRASSLYMIGVMFYHSQTQKWMIRQWFANDYKSETQMLSVFLTTLEDYECIYHYNGKTFDLPYLRHKIKQHGLALSKHNDFLLQDKSGRYSIDLLQLIRPLKKLLGLTQAGQRDVERFLGCFREDRFNGKELIQIYSKYMQERLLHPEQAQEYEDILLLHNHDDMKGMLEIMQVLSYHRILSPELFPAMTMEMLEVTGDFSNELMVSGEDNGVSEKSLTITYSCDGMVPKEVTYALDFPEAVNDSALTMQVTLSKDRVILVIPVWQQTLKYFIPDYENYYYLPMEDTAIHKSVAEFVERSYRKKATKSTCYLKRNAWFVPSRKPLIFDENATIPCFLSDYHSKCYWYEYETVRSQTDFWNQYALAQLQGSLKG